MTSTFKALSFSVLALIVALSCLAPSAQAQAISGDLVGNVVDASGAAVPNVNVTAINTATNVKLAGTTNTNGDYRIGNLPPGSYDVSHHARVGSGEEHTGLSA